MTTGPTTTPNHHAHHPGFAGPAGFLAAASMVLGGGRNAGLALSISGLGPDDTVADIGCGPGTAARRAAGVGASVFGIDPAQVMLRLARFLTPSSLHSVRYSEGSAEAVPLANSSVTVVWSIASVHHWANLDAGLKELRRVLRPGGRLVAIERLCRPGATGLASHGWTPEQASAFAELSIAHGFADAKVSQHPGRKPKISVTATTA